VDRDDLAARVEQRLVDRGEVADRGLRGRRAALRGAQPVEEGGVVADLGLLALVAVDRDVEADDLDPARGDQVGGEVGGAVADDGGGGGRAHGAPLV